MNSICEFRCEFHGRHVLNGCAIVSKAMGLPDHGMDTDAKALLSHYSL